MADSPKNIDSFKRSLFDKAMAPFSLTASYTYYKHIDKQTDPGSLARLLGTDNGFLSDRETQVLSVLESTDTLQSDSHYLEFKWKLVAFLSLQDIFDAPLLAGTDLLSLFRQWYFYYESKYLLIETILCGLNGFVGAQGCLLRLFLEFNVLQNYFYRNVNQQNSYDLLEKYCEKGSNPNWNTVIKGALPDNAFTKPIKRRILLHLQGLSDHSSHPYSPGFTLTRTGSALPEPTLERIFAYSFVSLILDAGLWLYFVNFPMLFHGVDIERKFGFNGPLGIFVDEQISQIIKRSLGERDHQAFYDYSRQQQNVTDLLAWYDHKPTLTDAQILLSWNSDQDGPIDNITEGHCMSVVKMRGLKESLALKPGKERDHIPEGQEDTIFDRLSRYDWWKAAYKRI
jgi:hypothetical protein